MRRVLFLTSEERRYCTVAVPAVQKLTFSWIEMADWKFPLDAALCRPLQSVPVCVSCRWVCRCPRTVLAFSSSVLGYQIDSYERQL